MKIDGQDVFVSRSDAQSIVCPRCSAAVGAPCIGAREKVRESNHMERIQALVGSRTPAPVAGECPVLDSALAGFAAEHFPGVPVGLVGFVASLVRRNGPATPERMAYLVQRWAPPATIASDALQPLPSA